MSATRVEPPLHPEGPEKITKNFGIEAKEFDFEAWNEWCTNTGFYEEFAGKVTEGVFAPWCMYKKDFLAIGGHDELFAPQSREDSDLFNRMQLAGYKFIQPWSAVVYHFTSRGSRFNKHAGGDTMKDSPEWKNTNYKNSRNFVRKWGTLVTHDEYMKPSVAPKYDIGFVIKNCDNIVLKELEPWCSTIYTDGEYMKYITLEQPNTKYNLRDRIKTLDDEKNNDILIEFDGSLVNNTHMDFIMNLPYIISDSGAIGTAEHDIFIINIQSMKTYEKELLNA